MGGITNFLFPRWHRESGYPPGSLAASPHYNRSSDCSGVVEISLLQLASLLQFVQQLLCLRFQGAAQLSTPCEIRFGFCQSTLYQARDPAIGIGISELRIEFNRLIVIGNGARGILFRKPDQAARVICLGHLGI